MGGGGGMGVLCMQQTAHTHMTGGGRGGLCMQQTTHTHMVDGWRWREGSAVYAADNSHSRDGWVEGGECCVCSRQLTLT